MELIILLLIAGVVMYFFPLDATIKKLIYVIFAVLLVLWLVGLLGGFFPHGPWLYQHYPR